MNNNIIINTSENPISLNLVNYGDKVKSIKLISADIPNVSYNINTTDYIIFKNTSGVNNTLYFNEGRYSILLFFTNMQLMLNANDIVTYTLSYNQLTNKIIIDNSNTGNFEITFKTKELEKCCGFIFNKLYISLNGIVTADNIFDFSYTSSFYIYSNIVNNNNTTYSISGKNLIAKQTLLGILQNSGDVYSYSYNYFGNLNDSIMTNGAPNNINILIYDDLNNIVNFHGLKYTLYININN